MIEPVEQEAVPREAQPWQRLLAGRYFLEERIAAGGMATVWRAYDETLARTVAVKILHAHLSADEDVRARFRREAVTAAKLVHPGIVGLYDTGEEGEVTFLVLEFVDGVTLRDLLMGRERLDVGEASAIGARVAEALGYAHARGLVHRDVKPANILIASDGTVKLADFGIAQVAESARDLTQTGTVLGTAAYVAPEQVRGETLDGRADLYALGCVLYETICGHRPFAGPSSVSLAARRLTEDPLPLRAIRPDVPRALDEIVMTALQREVDARFADGAAFAQALGAWETHVPLVLPAPETPEPADEDAPRSFLRSERAWLAPVIALLVVAATLTGVGLATGVLESTRVPTLPAARVEEVAQTAPIQLDPNRMQAFDPVEVEGFVGGDEVENDELLSNLLDGDADTSWRTERYEDPAFGRLKPGVGFVVDLGSRYTLSDATFTTTTPGISFDVRVADGRFEDAEDWEVAATVREARAEERVDLGEVTGQFVLVYIVPDLVDDGGGAHAELSTMKLRGERA